MCAHMTQQKWGRGLPVSRKTSCLSCSRRCKSTGEVSAAPALANIYSLPVDLLSLFCTAGRRNVEVRNFLGHCNLGDPFYLNCWSVCSWWLVMDSISCWERAEQFWYIPSNLSAFSLCRWSWGKLRCPVFQSSPGARVLFNCTGHSCDL